MTLDEIRVDPDFQQAAKLANPPLDLDGVKEVVTTGKGIRLMAYLILDDGQHVILMGYEHVQAFYGQTARDVAIQLLRALGKGEG